MNIFEEYLVKITNLILKNQKFLALSNLNNFKGITVETPPPEFNYDLSCNISLVLAKINKTSPLSCEAFIVVEMEWVEKLRTQLKPNKGFAVD